MRITYFYQEEFEKEYMSDKLSDHKVSFIFGGISEHRDFSDPDTETLCVFVNSKIGATEMDRFPNLKYIATRSTGFDHINLEEAKKRNIIVSNVPSYGENTVAEQAFALILSLSRKIYQSYNRIVEKGEFSQSGLRGFDLKGKTMGIIGTGRIGKHVAKIARGFEMKVLLCDIYPDQEFADDHACMYVGQKELLSQSDIVSIHVPYMPETHHMINMNNIEDFKRGSFLINTARGSLVETKALIYGLEMDILAGAGLDVLEEEEFMNEHFELMMMKHPNPQSLSNILGNQYLIDHPNVIVTPHNAFNTKEALERILLATTQNIEGFRLNSPINVVS